MRRKDLMIFEKARENAEAIRMGGRRALSLAAKAGVAAYYYDPTTGKDMIRHLPDGSRQKIRLIDGEDIVVETIGPSS